MAQQAFKPKERIQAVDPIFKQWLNGTINKIENKQAYVKWTGYPQEYDMWLPIEKIRRSEPKRCMLQRNKIKKENFPVRNHPGYLQGGDTVLDIARQEEFVVDINDPFRAEVKLIYIFPFDVPYCFE